MSSGLHRRAARLEQVFHPDPFDDLREFWFVMCPDPPIELVVPEGGRVVADLYEECSYENWGGRPGVTFRIGFRRERVTMDPDDHGRVLPASENPDIQVFEAQAAHEPQ